MFLPGMIPIPLYCALLLFIQSVNPLDSRRLLVRCARRHTWRIGIAHLRDLQEIRLLRSKEPSGQSPTPAIAKFASYFSAELQNRPSRRRSVRHRAVKGRKSRREAETIYAINYFWGAWRAAFEDASIDDAIAMFDDAAEAGLLDGSLTFSNSKPPSKAIIDAHGMSVPMARAAVCSALIKSHGDISPITNPSAFSLGITIVTGRGRHSPHGEARIRLAIIPFLERMTTSLKTDIDIQVGAINLGSVWLDRWRSLNATDACTCLKLDLEKRLVDRSEVEKGEPPHQ